jgi:hypothetical protein
MRQELTFVIDTAEQQALQRGHALTFTLGEQPIIFRFDFPVSSNGQRPLGLTTRGTPRKRRTREQLLVDGDRKPRGWADRQPGGRLRRRLLVKQLPTSGRCPSCQRNLDTSYRHRHARTCELLRSYANGRRWKGKR